MHDDVFQMYLDEMKEIPACTAEEEAALLERLIAGDISVKERLMEGRLQYLADLVRPYAGQVLPMGDLIQEANMAMLMLLETYQGGDFESLLKEQVESALQTALAEETESDQAGEEMLARINVLKRVSEELADELGREANLEELAAKMKMTEDEIKDIMKWTLDAMTVSPDAEE